MILFCQINRTNLSEIFANLHCAGNESTTFIFYLMSYTNSNKKDDEKLS